MKNDRHLDVPLIHKIDTIQLPMRLVTETEYIEAKAAVEKVTGNIQHKLNECATADEQQD